MDKIVWRCDITEEMLSHLNDEERKTFINRISDAVNELGQLYKVGREYKDGKLKENNYA
jgi:hypothetical protein